MSAKQTEITEALDAYWRSIVACERAAPASDKLTNKEIAARQAVIAAVEAYAVTAPLQALRDKIADEGVEGTALPFFGIAIPRGNGDMAWLAGPWFSREAADIHFKGKRHRYHKKAIVYCFSGHMSMDWRGLLEGEG